MDAIYQHASAVRLLFILALLLVAIPPLLHHLGLYHWLVLDCRLTGGDVSFHRSYQRVLSCFCCGAALGVFGSEGRGTERSTRELLDSPVYARAVQARCAS
ncbi:hypothetical protein BC628DRAFT_1384347 [Trametes gibbosa]|nr:hypothetical protein BC628DRAFT_1384347 [Trametes gibbosa]